MGVDQNEELQRRVEGGDGILVVRGSATHRDWNGIRYKTGLSAKNVSSRPTTRPATSSSSSPGCRTRSRT